jgi:hypothetical protein
MMTVRPLRVVLLPECIEGTLLGSGGGAGGTNRAALQRAMRALVRAVLLGGRGIVSFPVKRTVESETGQL